MDRPVGTGIGGEETSEHRQHAQQTFQYQQRARDAKPECDAARDE
jgi:hypothetical protein